MKHDCTAHASQLIVSLSKFFSIFCALNYFVITAEMLNSCGRYFENSFRLAVCELNFSNGCMGNGNGIFLMLKWPLHNC